MWFPAVVLVTALAATVFGQVAEDFASDCPFPNGLFADAFQCDLYYECKANNLTEKLCPDGMAFDDLDSMECEFHFMVDCTERPEFQPALNDPNCPHANGYFPHPDKGKCNMFHHCADGVAAPTTCPPGLVFSLQIGACAWPDQAGRTDGVDIKAVVNEMDFTCPKEPAAIAAAHPVYADPQDCQLYYLCISGVTPQNQGCKFGEVFSGETKTCVAPSLVPGCEKHFWEYFAEYFKTLGTGSTRSLTEVIEAATKSSYPVPENAINRLTKPKSGSVNLRKQPTQTSSAPASPVRSSSSSISSARRPIAAVASSTIGKDFTCPKEPAAIALAHPIYSDPQDCQFYYICISGVTPQHQGCPFSEVFSEETKACDAPSLVPGCEKYYWDYFVEYFETLGAGSARSLDEMIEAALKSNYPVPENFLNLHTKPQISSFNQRKQPTRTSSAPASPVRSSSSSIIPARRPIAAAAAPIGKDFTCPKEPGAIAAAHPIYSDSQDCQFYYLCISGVTPQHHGCPFGEVFNGETKFCDAPSLAVGCENHFWDYFVEYFETLGAGSTRSSAEVIEAALKSNYPVPENAINHFTNPKISSFNPRRQPTRTSSAPASPVRSSSSSISPARRPIAAAAPEQPDPVQVAVPKPQAGTRVPSRRRRPGAGVRRRVTTTTTTTTTPPPPSEPEYYYDYYYDDEPAVQPVQSAPQPPSSTHRFRN